MLNRVTCQQAESCHSPAIPPARQIRQVTLYIFLNTSQPKSRFKWDRWRTQETGAERIMCVSYSSIAFLVGGVGFVVLTQFVSFIWLSFGLSFRPDKHHYSVCWSWLRPHQSKHPHTETSRLHLTPCTHLTACMFTVTLSFEWLAELCKLHNLFLGEKLGVN